MIDELADVETSTNPERLIMPERTFKSYVTIDTYTQVGRARYIALTQKGLSLNEILKQMVEGIDYKRQVIPYVPYDPTKTTQEYHEYRRPRYAFRKGNDYGGRKPFKDK